MEFNEKKNNRGLIVVIILLIVLCLGLGGFIVYDKVLKEEPKKVEQSKEETKELIKGNTFKLSDIDCAKEETDKCVKQIELSYDNVNHDVKLIKKLIDNKYVIDVYIDNNLIDTLNGGQFYDWQENETAVDWLENLDGYIYVIDGKYLGLVYRVEGAKPSWLLKVYNDVKPFESDSDILVASYGGAFSVDGKTLNDLEALEFDGTSIKYWSEYCGSDIKPDKSNGDEYYMVVEQHLITFDGEKLEDVVVKTVTNAQGGGQSRC